MIHDKSIHVLLISRSGNTLKIEDPYFRVYLYNCYRLSLLFTTDKSWGIKFDNTIMSKIYNKEYKVVFYVKYSLPCQKHK